MYFHGCVQRESILSDMFDICLITISYNRHTFLCICLTCPTWNKTNKYPFFVVVLFVLCTANDKNNLQSLKATCTLYSVIPGIQALREVHNLMRTMNLCNQRSLLCDKYVEHVRWINTQCTVQYMFIMNLCWTYQRDIMEGVEEVAQQMGYSTRPIRSQRRQEEHVSIMLYQESPQSFAWGLRKLPGLCSGGCKFAGYSYLVWDPAMPGYPISKMDKK